MKPTSEMGTKESACFVNLKKAMNESYLLVDYLRQARATAPSEYLEIHIDSCIYEMEMIATDIKYAVSNLTK